VGKLSRLPKVTPADLTKGKALDSGPLANGF
jgi:hypothetical protein